jgi:Holliday junction resolvase RusA-like endonuclease
VTELYLPSTPSANEMWGYGRGRVFKTAAYKKWQIDAGLILNTQHPKPVMGPYKLTIQIRDGGRMDLDNVVKPTNDLLQKMKVVRNDKDCKQISMRCVTAGYDGLYVRIEPAGVE